jgi:TonB family protein
MVDLVSLPGDGSAGSTPKAEKPLPLPAPPPIRTAPKPIPLPKPLTEKPLQVKEEHTQSLEQALEKIKKKVQQEKTLEKTLSRLEDRLTKEQVLEKTLAQLEQKKQSSSAIGQGTGSGGSGNITASALGGQDMGIQNQLYYASLISRINKNWSLPEGLIKGKDISAVIVIQIGRNGKIEDAKFEQKSGIEAFDQQVLRTIKKSDPLPPLPEGFPKNIFDVGLTFSRKGLSGK